MDVNKLIFRMGRVNLSNEKINMHKYIEYVCIEIKNFFEDNFD